MSIDERTEDLLNEKKLEESQVKLEQLKANLATVIQGKDEVLDTLIVALISNSSVLMEDVPGVGKTTLAKALAASIDADYQRIQFTPDMLPADILGGSIYNPKDGSLSFREGPVFCNILLADEINRASPRTQSALLEAMAELQVTIESVQRKLPQPFLVIATENPIEFQGTYPLPEAQLDRFMLQLHLGYPSPEAEVDILHAQALSHPIDAIQPVLSLHDILSIQQQVRQVEVDPSITRYMADIAQATRNHPQLKLGVSPRGTLMLYRASQARAFSEGRRFILPDDVQHLADTVLAHRVILNTKAKYDGTTKTGIIQEVLSTIPVPV
jgi:MoxR-like ATPase